MRNAITAAIAFAAIVAVAIGTGMLMQKLPAGDQVLAAMATQFPLA